MKNLLLDKLIVACVAMGLILGSVDRADGGIIGVAGGPGDTGTTLGPYTMTPFTPDYRPTQQISTLASPLGGAITFSESLQIFSVASLGGQWSGTPPNTYSADVYNWINNSNTGTLTITLPSSTAAFSFYLVPNSYSTHETITATAQDGTFVSQSAQANSTGAVRFGFYTTGNDLLTTLTISDGGYNDFFIGEFAIAQAAVPEPSSFALLGLGGIGLAIGAYRRNRAAA